MQTRDEDATEATPPPGWVLNTPTRGREVWTLPALTAVLAVVLVALGVRFGEPLGTVVCVTSAVVVAAGAVALGVAGRRAYDEQDLPASWRLHVVRVVVGVTTAAVVAVGSLVVGLPLGSLFGAVAGVPMAFRYARSVPRTDRFVVAWASVFVAVSCLTLSVVGLTAPRLPERLSTAWIGPGAILGALALVMAVVQFVLAERTMSDDPLSAPDRTAS